jgi:hypothetical protein
MIRADPSTIHAWTVVATCKKCHRLCRPLGGSHSSKIYRGKNIYQGWTFYFFDLVPIRHEQNKNKNANGATDPENSSTK